MQREDMLSFVWCSWTYIFGTKVKNAYYRYEDVQINGQNILDQMIWKAFWPFIDLLSEKKWWNPFLPRESDPFDDVRGL